MKTLFTTIFLVFTVFQLAFSQAPKGFNYQTVLRDRTRQLLVNQEVTFRMSLLEDGPNGFEAYSETHKDTTDEFGRVSLIVGLGDPVSGEFDSLDWENVNYYLQVEIDPKGGNDFILMGAAPLLAVPVADHARTATWETSDNDRDPQNEVQVITKNGNVISLSLNGGEVVLNDDDPTNEIQDIILVNDSLIITQGNGVSLVQYKSPWLLISNGIYYPDGNTGVGLFNQTPEDTMTHRLHLRGNNRAIRLEGTGNFGSGARLNFGDSDYVYLEEDEDDKVKLRANRFWFDNGSMGIGTSDPSHKLHLKGGIDLLRLEGPGSFGKFGRINFGDGDFALIDEYIDDQLRLKAGRIFMDASVGIRTGSPNASLDVNNSFAISTSSGAEKVYSSATSAGSLYTIGANGQENISLGWLGTNENKGYILVCGPEGVPANSNDYKVGMYVDAANKGIIFKDINSFKMPHPTKPDKQIWYACIEGPEAAAYERGTAQLNNGEAFIPFTEHFEIVVNPATMTINLTPLNASSKGLAVIEKNANGFKVKELSNGTGNYQIDWEAKGVRKGYEDYRAIRDSKELQMAMPSRSEN